MQSPRAAGPPPSPCALPLPPPWAVDTPGDVTFSSPQAKKDEVTSNKPTNPLPIATPTRACARKYKADGEAPGNL